MGISSNGRNGYAGGFHARERGANPAPRPSGDDDGRAFKRVPAAPGARRARRRLRGRFALAGLACLGVLAFAWRAAEPEPAGPVPRPAAARPEWREQADAPPLFSLVYAEAPGLAQAHNILTRDADGARRDLFVLGEPDAPPLRLTTQRGGVGDAPAFFVEMARAAAETGRAVAFAAQPSPLSTRLGPFEAADVALARHGGETLCVGFRSTPVGAPAALRVSGFACAEPDIPGRGLRRAAACLIDSLELASVARDVDLERLFAARDLASQTDCVENAEAEAPPPTKALRAVAARGFSAP